MASAKHHLPCIWDTRLLIDPRCRALFIDLRAHSEGQPSLSTGDALGVLLADLGLPGADIPDSLDGRISVWRRKLLDAHVLVILDNASGSDQVANLLAGNRGCTFIITSRQRLIEIPGVLSVQLDSLPSAHAAELFQRVLGPGPMEHSESDATQIVGRIGGLPLAIRLTAARLRSHPAWTVRDLLKQDITRYPDLERVYALSYRDLSPGAQDVLSNAIGSSRIRNYAGGRCRAYRNHGASSHDEPGRAIRPLSAD